MLVTGGGLLPPTHITITCCLSLSLCCLVVYEQLQQTRLLWVIIFKFWSALIALEELSNMLRSISDIMKQTLEQWGLGICLKQAAHRCSDVRVLSLLLWRLAGRSWDYGFMKTSST